MKSEKEGTSGPTKWRQAKIEINKYLGHKYIAWNYMPLMQHWVINSER